ncbi:beta-ketoacyl synthase N-terminal-like domain-containing protein [Galbibacter sp. EGI 63066]|uniref:beta-ketoacyl-[acyl-carrier-protein] synthase family protein n=1 Tax=Galbibacter sp. EGI 63066 TaxID=2993559 RepID=UPI002248C53B|nr:beta-ketoacyl synthase N-terminal-like domain-containing protein [Galbibacter sp. EGI 63066]MCX2678338.1 beta-ketoacyl synthase N-terminal-like domain-containing protein [Galbibacter sp. EGI 63066]
MSSVYLSHNNIVSALGCTSEEVVANISNERSGLKRIDDKRFLPEPFCASLMDAAVLNDAFERFSKKSDDYTRLEKMMIASLGEVIQQSNLSITERTGLIISTTKGNIDVLEKNSTFSKERSYLHALGKTIKDFFGFQNDAIVVSNACVSGILSVAVAKRYIDADMYDEVLIVGGDLVTRFILSGFSSFQALSDRPCMPYSKNRTGINIGEVAASVLVTSKKENLTSASVEVIGEGSCNDANHISGPSRTGEGLYRSVKSAMKDSGIAANKIDYISAHGTATPYNDEMEAIAFNRLGLNNTPLNSLKGYFGHTLGASGLVETIVGMHALKSNTLCASLGFDELGVSQPINVIEKTTSKKLNTFLKTASGFGGCNTAVIFQKVQHG